MRGQRLATCRFALIAPDLLIKWHNIEDAS